MNKSVIFLIIPLILNACCLGTKDTVIDHNQYLGRQSNPTKIYDIPTKGVFYSPFDLSIEPMDRLILVDFKGDPIYHRLELQLFNDTRGKGTVVILYRKDRKVDIYCTNRLFVSYEPVGCRIFPTTDIQYRFDILQSGLDMVLQMKDHAWQPIDIRIKENRSSKPAAAFLAPAGSFQEVKFSFFPIFFMKKAYFVERAGTSIHIRINGKNCKPDTIPLPFNGSYIYQVVYVEHPIIGKWNINVHATLTALKPYSAYNFNGHRLFYELVLNDGHYEIKKIKTTNLEHTISMEFSPPIVNLVCLKDGIVIHGRFSAGVDEIFGIFGGEYRLARNKDQIMLNLYPKKAWEPLGFAWVESYSWLAEIQINGNNGEPSIKSAWIHKN